MSLAIVTPWKEHLELAPDYFAAVETGRPDQLVVVDDGSTPPLEFSALRIAPTGFCGASNAGLGEVVTDQVLFLNNDIRMLRPTWLDEIRAAIQPGVLIGPLVFRNNMGVVDHPYIDGWCVGMMTEDARCLGGWDEVYDEAGPGYFSDNALCLEARAAGMILRDFSPGIAHKGGQTGGQDLEVFQRALEANGKVFETKVKELVG